MEAIDIVTFSHLRWNFVFQRPQHLLSRLAETRRVLFIEEPITAPGEPEPRWELSTPSTNVTVCRLRLPEESAAFGDKHLAQLRPRLAELYKQVKLGRHVAWFYTPMAFPLLQTLKPDAVIYDCMDELSAFLNAPPELLEREKQLLGRADLVFTGGPSLYRAKKDRHPDVHCFPSSVDADHFAQAADAADDAAEQAALPRPRLGFFGVIDERLDIGLVDKLARNHPDWQIAMVGPVVKIDPATLPQHENLHYFGQQLYEKLPQFLAGWDVCLLPFARNRATRFISPTKTLEYMAAERMIVSTPITDVAEPYGDVVYLADTPAEFITECEAALNITGRERRQRIARMRDILSRTSWRATVDAMSELIDQAVQRNRATAAGGQATALRYPSGSRRKPTPTPAASASRSTAQPPSEDSNAPVVVIGAGPTGLSAAYHLDADTMLIERENRVGGICRSIEDHGFTFDQAGHIMFSKDPYVHEMYKLLLGDNVHWQNREAWIYSKGVHTRYPFQGCLYGLPTDVVTECIMGAIEARFGTLDERQDEQDHVSQAASRGSRSNEQATQQAGARCATPRPAAERRGKVDDCCGDGVLEAEAKLAAPAAASNGAAKREPRNFEEFIYQVWGRGIAKHFAIPYNRKLWAVPLKEMETSWLGGRVPMPNIEDMIANALRPADKPMGPNARFGYPLRGGFQALMDGFLPHVRRKLRLNTSVSRVSPSRRTVTFDDGTQQPYEYLVSTMPLPKLIEAIGEEAPPAVRDAAARLRYVSVRCVNIGVGRENLTNMHWIYYPEAEPIFHRIFVQGNASPHCNPPGGFGLTCEITYSAYKPLPCTGDELINRCIEDCHKVGIFNAEDPVITAHEVDLPHAYVVYDHQRPRLVSLIRGWLAEQDILLAGRYSEWEYYNSDHAFVAGKRAADQIRELRANRARAAAG